MDTGRHPLLACVALMVMEVGVLTGSHREVDPRVVDGILAVLLTIGALAAAAAPQAHLGSADG